MVTPGYRKSLESTWVHQVTGNHWRVRGYTRLQEITGEYIGTPGYRKSPESTWVHQVIGNQRRVRGYTKLQEITGHCMGTPECVGTPSYKNSPWVHKVTRTHRWVHQVTGNRRTEIPHVSDKYDDAIIVKFCVSTSNIRMAIVSIRLPSSLVSVHRRFTTVYRGFLVPSNIPDCSV